MRWAAALLVLVVGLCAALWLLGSQQATGRKSKVENADDAQISDAGQHSNGKNESLNEPGQSRPAREEKLLAAIGEIAAKLKSGNPEENAALLQQLREELTAADRAKAAAAILEFLKSGQDAATGLSFTVGKGGVLEGAPSLRVFLLDVLGTVSTGDAAVAGREILSRKDSADEWAVAMRNVAWGDPSAKGFLAGKMGEMFAYSQWREKPSAGYLEAFDVVVYAGATNLLPQIGEFTKMDGSAVQRAALVALDRMAASSTMEVLAFLNSNPGVLKERPYLRADYYAKANLDEPLQRQAVEAHLADATVSPGEKEKIVAQLGISTGFVSDNLLTPPPPPDDSDQRQQTFTRVANEWMKSNRFPELQPVLKEVLQATP